MRYTKVNTLPGNLAHHQAGESIQPQRIEFMTKDTQFYSLYGTTFSEKDVLDTSFDPCVLETESLTTAIITGHEKHDSIPTIKDEEQSIELRSLIDEVHFDKLSTIINVALDEMLDRVQHGDKRIHALTGDIARSPLPGKTLTTILKVLMERQDISRARLKIKSKASENKYQSLVDALRGDDRTLPIIDGELSESNGLDDGTD